LISLPLLEATSSDWFHTTTCQRRVFSSSQKTLEIPTLRQPAHVLDCFVFWAFGTVQPWSFFSLFSSLHILSSSSSMPIQTRTGLMAYFSGSQASPLFAYFFTHRDRQHSQRMASHAVVHAPIGGAIQIY
jgi:hypothetical protein